MSWTKRQLIVQAYSELGLADYVFDLSADQLADAMRKMNSMMATWNAKGIRLGYPMPTSASGGDLDDDSAIPDSANEAVYQNLAIRIAVGIGRVAPNDLKTSAKEAYSALLNLHSVPMKRHLTADLPLGAGNKPWRQSDNQYIRETAEEILAGGDGPIEFT